MSLLTIIQDVADLSGITRPLTVMSSTDTNVRRILAYANREGKLLAKRFSWQETTKEATFVSVSGEDQGFIETLAPGFNWDFYKSWWNRTQQDQLGGPLTPQQWQMRKASVSTGPYFDFRIRGKKLLVNPVAAVGETIAFEYVSRYWCESVLGVGQERWAADTDTGVLPEDLLTLGTHWRYLRSRGFSYAEEKQDYEIAVNLAMAHNGSKDVLYMDNGCNDDSPGIHVQEGSWPL